MKQKLLSLLLLITTFGFAAPNAKTTTNPSIGIMMTGVSYGTGVFLTISIKNTGDETLTNVYVTEAETISGMTYMFNFNPIASLAPGEEVTNLQAMKYITFSCFDESQVKVHATPASSTTEITDLSSDPYGYDSNGYPGSYYNNGYTYSSYYNAIYGNQDGVYEDTNNNNIVDVGDVVNYTYQIFSYSGSLGEIIDNNAIVVNPQFSGPNYFTTGIHYLTAADVALGYVYNSSYLMGYGPCDQGYSLQDTSYCACPNPNGANIVTPLTSLLPNQISGQVKYNNNNDNCATGLNFPNRRINTTDGNYTYSSYTNATGNYHILIPTVGTYTTTAMTNLNANFASNPASVSTTSSGTGVDYNNTNFCISSTTNYTDLIVTMFNVNQAIPGNTVTYDLYYNNEGSTSLNGTIQLTYDNGKLTFSNATPAQNSSTSNTLTWNYTNLLPFESRHISLTLNILTPPTANIGDLLAFSLQGTTSISDNNLTNNTFNWNQPVRTSFDPNDKTVMEGAYITPVQAANYLTYVTRFQNTGTANATTVVIKETLDPKLDWDTFEPIASSHTSTIQIKNGNDVTYTFSNIDLPYESANEPGSHGWMVYRIKPKSTMAIGDIAASHSDIYFDYNLPITTNTVTTQIVALSTADFVKSNFALYPNPATNHLVIEAKTAMEAQYQITDLNGKVLQQAAVESLNPIDISQLQSGFYLVTLTTEQGKATYKLIKN